MAGSFDTTSWSVVLAAKNGEGSAAQTALNALCRVYWRPIYAHVRRRIHDVEEAQDLTQEFFTRLLEHDFLDHVERERGRFRTFLLAALDHFLVNEWKRAHAQRRGGGTVTLPMDFAEVEDRLALCTNPDLDPRRHYDRQWARTMLDRVVERLEQEFVVAGKSELFAQLRRCLPAHPDCVPYRELGEQLGMSEGSLKVAVHRVRRRFAKALKEEVARTVEDPEDAEEELRYLIEVMGTQPTRMM